MTTTRDGGADGELAPRDRRDSTSRGGIQTCSQTPTISGTRLCAGFERHCAMRLIKDTCPNGRPNGPCAATPTRPYPRHCECDTERIHEHEKPRAPEHKPEPAEDPAGPLRSSSPTSATARSAAPSRAPRARGSCPPARSTRACSRRSTPRAAAARRSTRGVAEEALALARRPLGCPRAYRLDVARPQPRGVGARVRDRHRRLLRAERVQAQHVGRRQADRPRARARRPAARRADQRPADRLEPWRRHGERGGRRGRQDRDRELAPAPHLLRLHRPPRDGGGRARRGLGPRSRRSVPRPLHLRRGRAAAHAGRLGLGRRRAPAERRAARSASTCSRPRCSRSAPRPSSTRATGACTPICRTTSRASCRARGSSASCSRARGSRPPT